MSPWGDFLQGVGTESRVSEDPQSARQTAARVRQRVRAAALDRRPGLAAPGDRPARLTAGGRRGPHVFDPTLPDPAGPTSNPHLCVLDGTFRTGTAAAPAARMGRQALPMSPWGDFLQGVGTESRVSEDPYASLTVRTGTVSAVTDKPGEPADVTSGGDFLRTWNGIACLRGFPRWPRIPYVRESPTARLASAGPLGNADFGRIGANVLQPLGIEVACVRESLQESTPRLALLVAAELGTPTRPGLELTLAAQLPYRAGGSPTPCRTEIACVHESLCPNSSAPWWRWRPRVRATPRTASGGGWRGRGRSASGSARTAASPRCATGSPTGPCSSGRPPCPPDAGGRRGPPVFRPNHPRSRWSDLKSTSIRP